MKKNSQIHLYLETELVEKLRKQASEINISVSELYRRKLKEIPQLIRIEMILQDIKNKIIS